MLTAHSPIINEDMIVEAAFVTFEKTCVRPRGTGLARIKSQHALNQSLLRATLRVYASSSGSPITTAPSLANSSPLRTTISSGAYSLRRASQIGAPVSRAGPRRRQYPTMELFLERKAPDYPLRPRQSASCIRCGPLGRKDFTRVLTRIHQNRREPDRS